MNLEPNAFTAEIPDTLAATGEDYVVETIDIVDCGTTYEITKHGSTKKLYLTPVEDNLIDMVLYDKKGTALATCTLFNKDDRNTTSEKLTKLISLCF